jgi:hypothetical protein
MGVDRSPPPKLILSDRNRRLRFLSLHLSVLSQRERGLAASSLPVPDRFEHVNHELPGCATSLQPIRVPGVGSSSCTVATIGVSPL